MLFDYLMETVEAIKSPSCVEDVAAEPVAAPWKGAWRRDLKIRTDLEVTDP